MERMEWVDTPSRLEPRTKSSAFRHSARVLAIPSRPFRNLSQDPYERLGKNKQADASVRGLEQETSDLQAILHELEPGTVAIYTVIAPERLIIILVLPDARISREYPIKPEALREKVFGLRRMLLSPESDPLPAARQLYKIVLGR